MYSRFFKRPFDIMMSLVALVLFLPIILILTILGAIKMQGKPFFFQERPGKNERIFKLINLRWMQVVCGLHKIQVTIQTIICRRYTEFSLSSDFRHSIAGFAGVFAA